MIDLRYVDIENFMGIEKFSLDLEESGLKGSLIFLLGHNGAGKSSVLEAIFYALTSSTERMGRTKESSKTAASILRQGASHGYVEIHFVGADGVLYKVRRTFIKKGGKLITRASIRRKDGDRWMSLKGVADKDKNVSEILPRLLGIQGNYKDVLRTTFLIMQGKIDTMLMDTSPVDILSQSGVIPYKEEDIKDIIKSRQEKLKIQIDHAKGNVESGMKILRNEVDGAIDEFLYLYDDTIVKRWEDAESDALMLKVASDAATLLDKLGNAIEEYMPVFDGLRRLEDLTRRLEETERELEDAVERKKDMEEKVKEREAIIKESAEKLSRWNIKPSMKDAIESIYALKEDGLSPELIRIYSSMNPIDTREYESLYKRYYSYADKHLVYKVSGVYAYLEKLFGDKDVSYKDELIKAIKEKEALIREKELLESGIEELEQKLESLHEEIEGLKDSSEKIGETLNKLSPYYEKYKILKDSLDDLREIARLSEEINSILSSWENVKIVDIGSLNEKLKHLDNVRTEVLSIKLKLEELGDVEGETPNIEAMENWIKDYATYMARRDGVCPVDGGSVEKDDTARRPIPSDEVVRSVSLLKIDDMRRKRDALIARLKHLTGFEDAGKALGWVKKEIEELEESRELATKYSHDMERLERLKKERKGLLGRIPLGLNVEKINPTWVKKLENLFTNYEKLMTDKKNVETFLYDKENMLSKYGEDLREKERRLHDIEVKLKHIPKDIDLTYEMFDTYLYMKGHHRVFARDDIGEMPYYKGAGKDAQKVVSMYDTLFQIKDLVGKTLFNMWRKKGKLPTPDEVEAINNYIEILRGASSLTSREDFGDIYENIEEIVSALNALEKAEEEKNKLRNDISMLNGRIEQLRDSVDTLKSEIENIGRRVSDIPDNIKSIVGGKSPEAVIVRIRDMAERIREHVNSVSGSMETLEKLRYTERIYDFISRKLLSHFYHWYVDKIVGVFKERLSENLRMLSGRYTVSRLDKDSGIEVHDDWYGTTRPVRMLSGGERTMLGLAFIFALADTVAGGGGHRAFFIDEGFSALDAKRKEELRPVLENIISASGHTIFIITHDETILASAPPESPVIRMAKGKIQGGISTAQSEIVGMKSGSSEQGEDEGFSLLDEVM